MSDCEDNNKANINGAICCSSSMIFFIILFWMNFKKDGFGTLTMVFLIPILCSLAIIGTNLVSMKNCDTKSMAPSSN